MGDSLQTVYPIVSSGRIESVVRWLCEAKRVKAGVETDDIIQGGSLVLFFFFREEAPFLFLCSHLRI